MMRVMFVMQITSEEYVFHGKCILIGPITRSNQKQKMAKFIDFSKWDNIQPLLISQDIFSCHSQLNNLDLNMRRNCFHFCFLTLLQLQTPSSHNTSSTYYLYTTEFNSKDYHKNGLKKKKKLQLATWQYQLQLELWNWRISQVELYILLGCIETYTAEL